MAIDKRIAVRCIIAQKPLRCVYATIHEFFEMVSDFMNPIRGQNNILFQRFQIHDEIHGDEIISQMTK